MPSAKEDFEMVGLKYLKKSPEYHALQQAAKMQDVPMATWVKQAIREKLENEGYLSQGKLPKGKLIK